MARTGWCERYPRILPDGDAVRARLVMARSQRHVRIAGSILTIPSAKARRKNPARTKATQVTNARLERLEEWGILVFLDGPRQGGG
jgi:hypothetical protein